MKAPAFGGPMTLASRICALTVNPKVSMAKSGFPYQQQKKKIKNFAPFSLGSNSEMKKMRARKKSAAWRNSRKLTHRRKLKISGNDFEFGNIASSLKIQLLCRDPQPLVF